jgi:biotin transport system substrate-specific component
LSIVFLKNKAFLPQAFYLTAGILGLPVFTNGGSGFLYLSGPTGGYLLGFLAAAAIAPSFLPKPATFMKLFFLFIFVNVIVYCLGLAWLVNLYHFSLMAAISAGLLPFIAPELLKILTAAAVSAHVNLRDAR